MVAQYIRRELEEQAQKRQQPTRLTTTERYARLQLHVLLVVHLLAVLPVLLLGKQPVELAAAVDGGALQARGRWKVGRAYPGHQKRVQVQRARSAIFMGHVDSTFNIF